MEQLVVTGRCKTLASAVALLDGLRVGKLHIARVVLLESGCRFSFRQGWGILSATAGNQRLFTLMVAGKDNTSYIHNLLTTSTASPDRFHDLRFHSL